MSVILETKSTGVFTNTTSVPLTLPSGVASGDLVLALVSVNTRITTASIDQGWSQLSEAVGFSSCDDRIFYKTAGVSETAPTITLDTASYGNWTVFRISGADESQITASATASTEEATATATVTFPAITASSAGVLFKLATIDTGTHTGLVSRPTGTIENEASSSGTVAQLLYSEAVTAGAISTETMTLGSADRHISRVFLIYEASAALAIDSIPSEINPETSFSIQVSGPATAPTTGNTTGNFTGLTGIAPDSVTGSDPYTITWTLPRTTAKLFDATGYVFDITVDAETASTSAIPYEPPTGSDYITVGTIDTGAQVYTDYTGGTFVSTDQLVWDNSPSLSFTDDLNYVVTGTLSATVYRIAAAGTVDVENTISFTLGADGIVTSMVSPMVSNMISNMVN